MNGASNRRRLAAVAAVLLLAAAAPAPSRLAAAPGTAATVQGKVSGYDSAEYLLAGKTGQRLTVRLKISNRSGYFNLTAPSADTALFTGSIEGDSFDGTLPATGDYRITVYLMRNAARRGETAAFSLTARLAP